MKIRIRDTELFVETEGAGLPVMLMHGGMGFDHTCFRPWIDPLAEQLQLIYYDHRGNGRSEKIPDFGDFDSMTWVEDADKLRAHLGHEKIVLFGHSVGGFIAQEYALRYGSNLAGLILCCTAPAFDYPEIAMANARARGTAQQFQAVVKAFTEQYDDQTMKGLASEILPLYFKSYVPQAADQIVGNTEFRAAAAYYSGSTWLPVFNTLERLSGIRVPTLVLAGRADWIMPPEQGAERLHAGISGSQLKIFEASGHFPFIEEQEEFLRTVRNWISELA